MGYLLMHTRQTDVVASDAARMRKYEKRFLADMAAMLDRECQGAERERVRRTRLCHKSWNSFTLR
jgi:hypothetical protein